MTVFVLPTRGATPYRGKYPTRFRSQSHGAGGLHVELNDGTRLWCVSAALAPSAANPDCAALLARAVPMTAAQYETLREAAALLRTRAQFAGRGPRQRVEDQAAALLATIKAPAPLCPACDAMGAAQGTCPACYSAPVSAITESGLLDIQAELRAGERETAAPAPAEPAAPTVIDMTPTWAEIVPTLVLLATDGDAKGRAYAMGELVRLGTIADDLKTRRDVRAATKAGDMSDGETAAQRGAAPTACPYDSGSGRAAHWLTGYAMAAHEAREVTDRLPAPATASQARHEGAQAAAADEGRDACPYPDGTDLSEAWHDGYSAECASYRAQRRADADDDGRGD